LIENEKIKKVGFFTIPENARIIDAKGKYVIPGGIDPHVHFELPFMGTVSVDDYDIGTQACAAGGTTTFIDFFLPNQKESYIDAYEKWRKKADKKVNIDYALHGGVTWWDDKLSPY